MDQQTTKINNRSSENTDSPRVQSTTQPFQPEIKQNKSSPHSPTEAPRQNAWLLPNALSLDAALIAIIWQHWLAKALNTTITWPSSIILGISVWLAYTGDRWLDNNRLRDKPPLTLRHGYIRRYSHTIFRLWSCLLITNIGLALRYLSLAIFLQGLCLLALCIGYTIMAQNHQKLKTFPKELVISFLYVAGAIFFLQPNLNDWLNTDFITLTIALSTLSYVNCSFIAHWEKSIDQAQNQISIAQQWTHSDQFCRGLLCFLTPFASFYLPFQDALTLMTIAVSSLMLDIFKHKIHLEHRRALADSLLLLPIFVLAS